MLDISKATVFWSENSEDRLSFLCKFATGEKMIIKIDQKYNLIVKKLSVELGGTTFMFEAILVLNEREKVLCRGSFNSLERKGMLQEIKQTEWEFGETRDFALN